MGLNGTNMGKGIYGAYHDNQTCRHLGAEDVVPVDEVYGYEPGKDSRAELDETKEEEDLDGNPTRCGLCHS